MGEKWLNKERKKILLKKKRKKENIKLNDKAGDHAFLMFK